jgi:hypothetical protein
MYIFQTKLKIKNLKNKRDSASDSSEKDKIDFKIKGWNVALNYFRFLLAEISNSDRTTIISHLKEAYRQLKELKNIAIRKGYTIPHYISEIDPMIITRLQKYGVM